MNLRRVFVANRGEIAARIVSACRSRGLQTVVATSTADVGSMAARNADRKVVVGGPRAHESYLNIGALVGAAVATRCDGVHPGYGFLAENAEFASACREQGLKFIGPSPQNIATMGNKLEARRYAMECGLPVVPGSVGIEDIHQALLMAHEIGFPVLVKAAAGGGGQGIRIVDDADALKSAIEYSRGEARAAFGDASVYIEKYIPRARHVEVQIFGDSSGNVVHLYERDCSIQRRYQKIIEESPTDGIPQRVLQRMREGSVKLARLIGYENAGTIEYIYDIDSREFYFLEMNTRIQVEHPVTEYVTGTDLVDAQLLVAGGLSLPWDQDDIQPFGHSIECRITAEDPSRQFHPSPGIISEWFPPIGMGVRLDSHAHLGYTVSPYYDSMVGKLVVWGNDRPAAVHRMVSKLAAFRIEGIQTNIRLLKAILEHEDFAQGLVDTKWLERSLPSLL